MKRTVKHLTILFFIISCFSVGSKPDDKEIINHIKSYNTNKITSDSLVNVFKKHQFYFCVTKSSVNPENGKIQLNSPIETIIKDDKTYLVIYTSKDYEKEIQNESKYNALAKIDIFKYLKIYLKMNMSIVFNPNNKDSVWLESEKTKNLTNSYINLENEELQNIISNIKTTPCLFDGKKIIDLKSCKISSSKNSKFSYYSSKLCDTINFVSSKNFQVIFKESDDFEIVKLSNDTILKTFSNRIEYLTTYAYDKTHHNYKIFQFDNSETKYGIINKNKITDTLQIYLISNKL